MRTPLSDRVAARPRMDVTPADLLGASWDWLHLGPCLSPTLNLPETIETQQKKAITSRCCSLHSSSLPLLRVSAVVLCTHLETFRAPSPATALTADNLQIALHPDPPPRFLFTKGLSEVSSLFLTSGNVSTMSSWSAAPMKALGVDCRASGAAHLPFSSQYHHPSQYHPSIFCTI